jgi:hypothetical protein
MFCFLMGIVVILFGDHVGKRQVAVQGWVYATDTLYQTMSEIRTIPSTGPTLKQGEQQADLNLDGQNEIIRLTDQHLSVTENAQITWESPAAWQVYQFRVTELNHDDQAELTLLVWRPFAPWPIDQYLPAPGRIRDFHDNQKQSCHIIISGWKHGQFRELWAGSALAAPLTAFEVVDLDADNHQELVALESSYARRREAPAIALTAWEWNGFGFTLLGRAQGSFSQLQLIKQPNRTYQILTYP